MAKCNEVQKKKLTRTFSLYSKNRVVAKDYLLLLHHCTEFIGKNLVFSSIILQYEKRVN